MWCPASAPASAHPGLQREAFYRCAPWLHLFLLHELWKTIIFVFFFLTSAQKAHLEVAVFVGVCNEQVFRALDIIGQLGLGQICAKLLQHLGGAFHCHSKVLYSLEMIQIHSCYKFTLAYETN